ncbi:MAG: Hsp33 family molecular chaperone HslO [Candidatus Cloacimonadia bacterium]
MSDIIKRGISTDYHLRYFFVEVSDTIEQGRKIHQLKSLEEEYLFSSLTIAGLMIGADLKSDDESVTLKVTLNDNEQYLLVTGNRRGEIKGFPNFSIKSAKGESGEERYINIKALANRIRADLQDGFFTVIKDIGLKMPYNGTTKLITGELARDITYYFTTSEQTPSSVGISVIFNDDGSIKKGVGFIVQILPEATETTIELLEQNLMNLPELSDLLEMGMSIEEIMEKIVLQGIEHETLAENPVKYHCDCSKDRFTRGLKLLGESDLRELLESDELLKVQCHYCGSLYEFSRSEMGDMLAELEGEKRDE